MSCQLAVHIFFMLLCTVFSERRELELDQFTHHTEAISITEFKNGWAQKGYEVTVLDSLHDFKQHFEARAWKSPLDQAGPKTDWPLASAVPLPTLVESTLFYHGGNIKSSRYGGGVSDIKFNRTMDVITGPCYFVFENAFAASFYGKSGIDHVKAMKANGSAMSAIGYRQIMELKISQPDKCVGLVPDWEFLAEIAKLDQANKTAFIEAKCGKDCAFIAINWNKAGQPDSGLLPYEFRLFPASIVRCKISLNKVIAVKDDLETLEFAETFRSDAFRSAATLFQELLHSGHPSNFHRENYNKKFTENSALLELDLDSTGETFRWSHGR